MVAGVANERGASVEGPTCVGGSGMPSSTTPGGSTGGAFGSIYVGEVPKADPIEPVTAPRMLPMAPTTLLRGLVGAGVTVVVGPPPVGDAVDPPPDVGPAV